jgi:hypothetical protein
VANQRQAFIRATPNPVPYVAPPEMGTTTIAWSTGDGAQGVISVQESGGEEQLFAEAAEGEKLAGWIIPGVDYQFRLYSRTRKRKRPLRALTLRMEEAPVANLGAMERQPFIKATPNPVPDLSGPELGRSTIEWSTGDNSVGWIFLRTAGGKEVLLASGPFGGMPVPWIQRNLAYRFTLYGDKRRKKRLGSVTVTTESPRSELALDLAVVGGAIVAVATPVAVIALAVRRVARKVSAR